MNNKMFTIAITLLIILTPFGIQYYLDNYSTSSAGYLVVKYAVMSIAIITGLLFFYMNYNKQN